MKRVVLIFVLLASTLSPAQRIETETSVRNRIVYLKTALNHVTVIELAEPVVQVAAGSSSFRVEWRENKVFVQPTEANVSTNLFIWTANQRLNYELEPASAVAEMDFAVDQAPVPVDAPKPTSVTAPAPPSITDLLLTGKPVRLLPSKRHATKPVEVWISDLYEKDGRLLIRYAVRNHTREPYLISTPAVYQLYGVRSPQSLYNLSNCQLADEQAAKLKAKQQIPVKVVEGQTQPARVAPGGEAIGVVVLRIGSSTHPTILRFEFRSPQYPGGDLSDRRQLDIEALLVL